MFDFDFTIPSTMVFLRIHKLGLIEESSYETCGKEYFTLSTWKNDESINE